MKPWLNSGRNLKNPFCNKNFDRRYSKEYYKAMLFTKPQNDKTIFLGSAVGVDAPFRLAYAIKESLDDGFFLNECFDIEGEDRSLGIVELGAFNYAFYTVDDEGTHIQSIPSSGENLAKAMLFQIVEDIASSEREWAEYVDTEAFFDDFDEYYREVNYS